MMKKINTELAPAAIGPYSQAIQAGDFLFVSGQLPIDPKNGELVEGIEKQAEQSMKNIQAILKEAGADLSQVVKTTIYLSSMEHFAVVNEIYGSFFKEPYPARAAFQVARLPKDALVEIEAIVYTK